MAPDFNFTKPQRISLKLLNQTKLLKSRLRSKCKVVNAARSAGCFVLADDGGAREDRTPDLLRARQALSQLSYGPATGLVGLGGFEPPTSPLSGVRSNQLSYRPKRGLGLRSDLRVCKVSGNLCGCSATGFDGFDLRR